MIFDELSFPFAIIQSPGSTNGTSYDDMVFIPVVRTELNKQLLDDFSN